MTMRYALGVASTGARMADPHAACESAEDVARETLRTHRPEPLAADPEREMRRIALSRPKDQRQHAPSPADPAGVKRQRW